MYTLIKFYFVNFYKKNNYSWTFEKESIFAPSGKKFIFVFYMKNAYLCKINEKFQFMHLHENYVFLLLNDLYVFLHQMSP